MDVHKSKPVHSWRELLAEVGTIVIGVLIALAAEQTVEAFHWKHKVAEAEDAMRLELRDDDLPQAYARAALDKCLSTGLTQIEAALSEGRDHAAVAAAVKLYDPPLRTWDMEAWRAAVASDSASHMSAARMTAWSSPYRLIPAFTGSTADESDAKATLRAGQHLPGPLSETDREAKLRALEKARATEVAITAGSYNFLKSAQDAGVRMDSKAEQGVLAELRGKYGDCLQVPKSWDSVDYNRQSN